MSTGHMDVGLIISFPSLK